MIDMGMGRRGAIAAAALLAGALAAPSPQMAQPIAPPMQKAAPQTPARATVKRQLTRRQISERNARRRRRKAAQDRYGNRARHAWDKFNALVQPFSNRERQAWAQRGYPGLLRKEVDVVKRFIEAYREVRLQALSIGWEAAVALLSRAFTERAGTPS